MQTDQELISNALDIWANYIETGTTTLSAQDLGSLPESTRKKLGAKLCALSPEQHALVTRLRALAFKQRGRG